MLSKIEKKAKRELVKVIDKLSSRIEIGYGIAMDSFKKEAKKRGLGEYYY